MIIRKNIQRLSMMLSMILSSMLLTIITSAAFAETKVPLKQADFMFTAVLEDAQTSLRRLPLDASMLQHMQTPGMYDVRVFDASGQMVPAMLRKTQQQVEASEHALNFFPLYGDKTRDVRLSSTDVERDDSGQVVAIRSRQSNADQQRILTAYVIDQTAHENEQLSELEFGVADNDEQFMLSLRIETSTDLTNWSTLDKAAVVAHFQVDEQVMHKNVIKLSAKAKRYLRLTLLGDAAGFELKKIIARYNTPGQADYSWLALGKPEKIDVEGRTQYEFVIPGGVNPAMVKFGFSGNEVVAPGFTNGLVSGQLYSLSTRQKWVARQTITQYRIVLAEGEIESDPVRLGSSGDRRWRFEPADGRPLLEPNIPEIKLAYPKLELVFVAQGPAPYSVAWGHAEAGMQSSPLAGILKAATEDDIAEIRVLATQQLAELPAVADENDGQWRKWLLFAVLLLAVLGAGRMAYQLFREMNA